MNIVITGASRGIGYHTALALAADPVNRIIAISRNEEGLRRLVHAAIPGNIIPCVFDITAASQHGKLLSFVLQHFRQVDVLVNNAAVLLNKPFSETTQDDWLHVFKTNLFAAAELIRLLLPYMGLKRQAHIVNIGSMGGFQGSIKFKGLAAYSTSKASLAALTECLAEELSGKNISVNCLAPGAVQTEMFAAAFPGFEAPVTPAAMGAFVAQFALTGHTLFNGQILPVSLGNP